VAIIGKSRVSIKKYKNIKKEGKPLFLLNKEKNKINIIIYLL